MAIHDGMVPQPFGTPQMAMNAAMSSIGHLLSWTQFLEAEATQRNAPAHMSQHFVHPQHLVHSQPKPHRGRR
jgi:cobyric acid synthase